MAVISFVVPVGYHVDRFGQATPITFILIPVASILRATSNFFVLHFDEAMLLRVIHS